MSDQSLLALSISLCNLLKQFLRAQERHRLENLHEIKKLEMLLKHLSCRRRFCVGMMSTLASSARSKWVIPRVVLWWDTFVLDCRSDDRWIANFRLSRDTFYLIVSSVKPYMEKQDTNYRRAVAIEKRVAVAVYKLATGCSYNTLRELFGIGKSTACQIMLDFPGAVIASLKKRYLRWPTAEKFQQIQQGFQDAWGFPYCCGAIDGTHFPIVAPSEHRNDYYNRKSVYSIIGQAVCDHEYKFWDMEIGWPGKTHDARVFKNSLLYKAGQDKSLFPNTTMAIGSSNIPMCIVGDAAYPLMEWLMKPFPEHPGTPEDQRNFNYRLSRARMVIECAFGRLKGRFRLLMKRNDSQTYLVPNQVLCCAILHNICESRGEPLPEDLDSANVHVPADLSDCNISNQTLAARYRLARCQYVNDVPL